MSVLLEISPVTLLLVPPALVLLAAISLAQFGMVFRAFSSFAKARHGMLGAVQPGVPRTREAMHARRCGRVCERCRTTRVRRNASDRHPRHATNSAPERGLALGIDARKRGQVCTWPHARAVDGTPVGSGAFHGKHETRRGESHLQAGLNGTLVASSVLSRGSLRSDAVPVHAGAPCRRGFFAT
eukprot:scaffold633_cov321-Pavlova_lutheri.AAC.18